MNKLRQKIKGLLGITLNSAKHSFKSKLLVLTAGLIAIVTMFIGSYAYYIEYNRYELINIDTVIIKELMQPIEEYDIDVSDYIQGNDEDLNSTIIDYSNINIEEVGSYSLYFKVEGDESKTLSLTLQIEDTMAPIIEIQEYNKDILLSKESDEYIIPLIDIIAYSDYSDIQSISVSIDSLDISEVYENLDSFNLSINKAGEFTVEIVISDIYGNENESSFVIISDYDYESFIGDIPTFSIYEGNSTDLSSGVSYEYPFIDIKIDDTNVDYDTKGTYTVYYTFYTEDNFSIEKTTSITISELITIDSILAGLDYSEYPIQTEGSVSVSTLNNFIYYWDLVPDKIQDKFYEDGWRILITTKNIQDSYYTGDVTGNIVGLYQSSTKTLFISTSAPGSTLIHEMGHYLDYQHSIISLQDEFSALYASEQDTFVARGSSDKAYGISNPKEFFAEVFANLILYPNYAYAETPGTATFIAALIADF